MSPALRSNVFKILQARTFPFDRFQVTIRWGMSAQSEDGEGCTSTGRLGNATKLRSLGEPLQLSITKCHPPSKDKIHPERAFIVSHLTLAHLGPPSKTLSGIAVELTSLSQYPILDAGCGFGRNAVAIASRGLSMVFVDHEGDRFHSFALYR